MPSSERSPAASFRLIDRTCALEGISDSPEPAIELDTLLRSRALRLSEENLAELPPEG